MLRLVSTRMGDSLGIPGAARLWVVQEKESSEVFSFAVRKYEWGKQVVK